MTDRTATLTFSDGSPARHLPDPAGDDRPGRHRHPHAVRQDRQVHLRPGLHVDRVVQLDDHLHRRRQGRAPLPRLSDRGARGEVRLPRGLLPAALRRAAGRAQQKEDFVEPRDHHTMVNEQMQFFMRGFRRDAHPMAVMTGLVGALSAFYPDSMNLHDAHQRDISAIRLIAKLPTLVAMAYKYSVGPAVHVSAQRAVVRGELHADDVRHAVRGLQGQRRAGARARPHLHPARRPRAERVDVDGAACARRRARTRSRRSPPASPACGARRTAAPTRRRSTCCTRSRRRAASRRSASSSRR